MAMTRVMGGQMDRQNQSDFSTLCQKVLKFYTLKSKITSLLGETLVIYIIYIYKFYLLLDYYIVLNYYYIYYKILLFYFFIHLNL